MTKKLTEQWRDGELFGFYYVKEPKEEPKIHNVSCMDYLLDECGVEVLSSVPSYKQLYGPNDGNIPVGLFTVLKIIKRDIEQYQNIRPLTDLECGIKSQVVSLLKRWGWNLGKDEPVSNSDELVQKMHILEKQLDIATKALKKYESAAGWGREAFLALKEMEGVK